MIGCPPSPSSSHLNFPSSFTMLSLNISLQRNENICHCQ
jgi:hypothetical protein